MLCDFKRSLLAQRLIVGLHKWFNNNSINNEWIMYYESGILWDKEWNRQITVRTLLYEVYRSWVITWTMSRYETWNPSSPKMREENLLRPCRWSKCLTWVHGIKWSAHGICSIHPNYIPHISSCYLDVRTPFLPILPHHSILNPPLGYCTEKKIRTALKATPASRAAERM